MRTMDPDMDAPLGNLESSYKLSPGLQSLSQLWYFTETDVSTHLSSNQRENEELGELRAQCSSWGIKPRLVDQKSTMLSIIPPKFLLFKFKPTHAGREASLTSL